jgi:hypothetical protein
MHTSARVAGCSMPGERGYAFERHCCRKLVKTRTTMRAMLSRVQAAGSSRHHRCGYSYTSSQTAAGAGRTRRSAPRRTLPHGAVASPAVDTRIVPAGQRSVSSRPGGPGVTHGSAGEIPRRSVAQFGRCGNSASGRSFASEQGGSRETCDSLSQSIGGACRALRGVRRNANTHRAPRRRCRSLEKTETRDITTTKPA